MVYKCCDCGHIFEDGEQIECKEHHPYGMGYAAESFSGCPLCKGDFEETKQCKICGGEFLEDELLGVGVCDECIEEYSKNFDTCYNICADEKEEVKINALLASLFEPEEIETILYHYAKTLKDVNCSNFVNQNKDWFADKLVEEVMGI